MDNYIGIGELVAHLNNMIDYLKESGVYEVNEAVRFRYEVDSSDGSYIFRASQEFINDIKTCNGYR